ncbi:uncharacterized protein [Triticum aestivum]|uniref:uncharacterized protein n=1 Tax=Triticum aestivum TaxID=4565 RepID=UPI001D00FAF9|nr:uncharacterized protein LOC123065530 [Triticum aestivum]
MRCRRSPDPPPPMRWAATFSSAFLDGRTDWRPGSLFLDRPAFCFLRNGDDKIEEGRHLRTGERIQSGTEMVLLDCVVRVGGRVFPERRRLTLAPGDLSRAVGSPSSGSRFRILANEQTDEDEAGQFEETSVPVQSVNAVLSCEDHDGSGDTWSTVARRKKSKAEIVQEFWEDVGFPAKESRVWERRDSESPSSSSGQIHSGSFLADQFSDDYRSQQRGVDAKPAATAKSARRGVPIRPWKGPLPRPRSLQPVALAVFWPEPPVATNAASADRTAAASVDETAAAACSNQALNMDRPIDQAKSAGCINHVDAGTGSIALAEAGGPQVRATPRLGLTLRRTDLLQGSRRPSTRSPSLSRTSSLAAPLRSYAAVLRQPSPAIMAS